jgi:predicted 3-demethylubiquinone-9 3-methyltransferase (glyoxalase superfamily)
MPKITPFLWFDDSAEEAAQFYASVFKNSRVEQITRYSEAGPGPAGSAMTVEFALDGQKFTAINGGPAFRFTEAVSFVVHCETQSEIDEYWDKLTADGGKPVQCGWLKDKYGLCWQIVPTALLRLIEPDDSARVARVMREMFTMVKLDIARLEAAAKG